jgi:hypothetical protein
VDSIKAARKISLEKSTKGFIATVYTKSKTALAFVVMERY